MRGSAFHQANATVTALSTEMAHIRNDLVNSINALSAHVLNDDSNETPDEAPPAVDDHQANAALSNQTALLSAIQELQTQVRELRNIDTRNGGRGRGRDGNPGRGRNGNPGRGRDGGPNNRRRYNTSKYCWTHGACAHTGTDCTSPTEGHKSEATFENKMGGSTAYCGNRN